MINGAHVIVSSRDAEADRAFFRDVLQFPFVDARDGWLIFALPTSELAVHPHEDSTGAHEMFLMCDDVEAEIARLVAKGVAAEPVTDAGWGLLTYLTLPGGGRLGLYQPRHARP